jgi:hypothetical protein
VVVAGAGDQVARAGLGAVGDADRGAICDDAELDEVVADAAGQLAAQRVLGGHQQGVGAVGGQGDVGGRGRVGLSPAQITEQLAAIAPATIRGRARIPAPARHHVKLKVDGPVHETWTLGYLTDTIYLRDLWMHRIDAARAARQPAELTASHDGRIVADITAEWARRHGKPFTAELSGPAGGTYASDPADPAAEHISMDAVEFCRTLAGRAHPTGLLTTIVPF